MYFDVDLSAEPPRVSLTDLDNFQAFQIEACGPRDRMAAALEPFGRWDGEYGWFDPAQVAGLAGERATDPEWQRGFAGLRAYAEQHGYTGPDGALRAHAEWRS